MIVGAQTAEWTWGTRHYSIQEAPPASKVVHALLIYMHAVKCEGLGPQKWLHALRLVGGPWVVRFLRFCSPLPVDCWGRTHAPRCGVPWFPVVSRGQSNSGSNGVDSGPIVSPRVAQLASSSSTAYVEVVVAWVTMGCAWSP